MEGQVVILVFMVVAGLVSMVKKALAEEKKKQEALIRAAQARKKQAAVKTVTVTMERDDKAERIKANNKRRQERRDGLDQEQRTRSAQTVREGVDQERQTKKTMVARERMPAEAAPQPPPSGKPAFPAIPEQPEHALDFALQEQLQDKTRVLELFVLKEVLDKPVALRRR